MISIYSDRLQFRKPKASDAPVLFAAYTQDSEVTKFTTWKPHISVDETTSFINMCIKKWDKKEEFNYIIEFKKNKQPIGMLKIKIDKNKANIGYVIARAYWNQGYATESMLAALDAIFTLGHITEIQSFCDTQNRASARVMVKAGMSFVKVLPNYIIHPNLSDSKRDCLLYSVLKDEYKKGETNNSIQFGEKLKQKYGGILVIVSPPRCGSTALARFFWHQPTFRYYSHEPYETIYYNGDKEAAARAKLLNPIDLSATYSGKTKLTGQGLIVKEMPYQVGSYFSDLISFATYPIIFMIRDPRLNIKSRIDKRRIANQPTNFPLIETGWELIRQQIDLCDRKGQEFVIVDCTEMRNHPSDVFSKLTKKMGLPFEQTMFQWQQANEINLDNLGGRHSHLYQRVLNSNSIEPATECMPEISDFPEENGFRQHVQEALSIYQALKSHPKKI